MPIYVYKCVKCSEIFDEYVSLKDKDKKYEKASCPKCKGKGKRYFAGETFTFKVK